MYKQLKTQGVYIVFCVFNFKKVLGRLFLIMGAIFVAAMIKNNISSENSLAVFNPNIEPTYTIVVDAGHGEPDGGAISKSGVAESGLNLAIALMLEEELDALGYNVIMTRKTEENIADKDKQSPIRSMKVSDINNRIDIVNNCSADMLISIHMNNFEDPKYYGWQTFFKKNSNESEIIAQNIQKGISNNIERQNDRVALPITNIKLIDNSEIPAVIVECGFLSNEEDLRLLLTDEYKLQIVNGIIEGIEKCYESFN